MKHIRYNFLILCVLLCTATGLKAQVVCQRNFLIKSNVTASTCMANGIIDVTLEGDLNNIKESMTEYALRPINGTEGTSLQFTTDKQLKGIAAGTYIVSVRTFCVENDQVGVVTESANVTVGGTYKPLMAEFDLSRVRKSYTQCATGRIAFNIKSGTGYGPLTYYISAAPAGVTTGQIFATLDGNAGGYLQYTVPGLYPSGVYQIDVYDGCSKATMTFTLGTLTGFPTYNISFRRSNSLGASHNKIENYNSSGTSSTTYPDHYPYYRDQMYEIALVPAAKTPTASDWVVWNSTTLVFTVPGGYKDYYASQSLKVYIRVKDCDATMKLLSTTQLSYPYMSLSSTNLICNSYSFTTTNYTDGDGFWSYPINIKITNTTDSSVVHNQNYATPSASVTIADALYGKKYSILVTDAAGITSTVRNLNTSTLSNFSPYLADQSYTYGCNTFNFYLYLSASNRPICLPVNMLVTKKNKTTGLYEHFLDYTFTTTNSVNFEWGYGDYKIVETYPNHIKDDGNPYQYARDFIVASPRPTSFTLASYTSTSLADLSNDNYGYLYINSNIIFPANTRFTVTAAPVGYRHIGRTITTTSSSNNFYLGGSDTGSNSSSIYMPEGNYTINVSDDCGTNLTNTVYLKTGFDAKNVKYEVVDDGCNGALIKLKGTGYVNLKGVPNTSYTNFKIISGPNGGYEAGLKKYNESLRIVSDGQYIIGTVIYSSSQSYYIRRDTINFVKSKPTLKTSATSAYVCTDPGSDLGYIIFTGQGGKAPYKYQLLDKDKNPIAGLTATGGADERVVFNHGAAGETYVVQITDDCGNATTQEVRLADLKTQSITYSIPPTGDYCAGDVLMLNCITLGQTTYRWDKKNSQGGYDFVSNQQNPRISPVTEAHSGTYRVTVMPEYCGDSIRAEVTVKVFPNLVAGTATPNQEVCVATRATTMSSVATGGKGLHKYQWQSSTDGNNWTNIAVSADRATYDPPIFTKSGRFYYRLQTTDDCKTVLSQAITLDVKPCYIMVNPSIRQKVKK